MRHLFIFYSCLVAALHFTLIEYNMKRNLRAMLTNTNYRSPRTISPEESCKQSAIKSNVTLKGGIEAGYFRKLAEHVTMQLCIELCCEEKGCDVAFMTGKNCYGVQCFSVEFCQALPAKKKVTDTIMISQVTIKGERGKVRYNFIV